MADARSRQNASLIAGAVLGVAVVVAVLLVTLRAGDPADETPDVAPTTPVTVPEELATPVSIPEGDYGPLCAELATQIADLDPTFAVDSIALIYGELDFDALAAVAPDGLVLPLTKLADDREEVLAVLEQVDSLAQVAPADLPAGFLDALALVGQAKIVECDGGTPPTAPTATTVATTLPG
jgi:hypothetical protein